MRLLKPIKKELYLLALCTIGTLSAFFIETKIGLLIFCVCTGLILPHYIKMWKDKDIEWG